MTKKIFRAIMSVALIVLLAGLIIIMGCLYDYFASVQEAQLKNQLQLAAAAVEDMGVDYLEGLSAGNSRLTWVAADGAVLYDSAAGAATMENHGDRREIIDALAGGEGEIVRYSSTLMKKTVYYARALSDGTVLRISVDRATAATLTLGMLPPILLVLFVAVALSAFLAGRLSKRIVEPLNALDLEHPLENEAYEELSPLLRRINYQHTEINRQLSSLRRQQNEFAQIIESMSEGLVLLDERGCVLSINPTACRIFETSPSCVGQDFLTVDRSHEVSLALERVSRDAHAELRVTRGGLEYQLNISRIEAEGRSVGAVLLAFDMTEQAYAERNRREFTANVSHELKTPLQSIIGSAELIENGLVKSEDMPRFVGRIREEATRLVALIEDIIRLSQLDEGAELPREQVELLSVSREALDCLSASGAAMNVLPELHGESVTVTGVRRLIYEIVYNLCDNAIKYNVPGGRVDVTVAREQNAALIEVRDSGIGIPKEDQSRIFERFYRVDKSHSKASGGTGLGLAIVKHAVAYHKGKLELVSEEGAGTCVRVRLPI